MRKLIFQISLQSAQSSKNEFPILKLEINYVFLRHFSFHKWRVRFAYLLANELELNLLKNIIFRAFICVIKSINTLFLLSDKFKTFPEKKTKNSLRPR